MEAAFAGDGADDVDEEMTVKRTLMVELRASVEPRLQPLQLSTEPGGVELVDDADQKYGFARKLPLAISCSREESEFPIVFRLAAPPRSSKKIKSLTANFDVKFPARIDTFVLAMPTDGIPSTASKSSTRVSLQKVTNDEGLWTFAFEIESLAKISEQESHLRAMLQNEVYLQKADGTKFAHNAGLSSTEAGEGKLGYEYNFTDAPGSPNDYKLVVKIPLGISQSPVRLEFNDIELP
jgi:hypothetical protein